MEYKGFKFFRVSDTEVQYMADTDKQLGAFVTALGIQYSMHEDNWQDPKGTMSAYFKYNAQLARWVAVVNLKKGKKWPWSKQAKALLRKEAKLRLQADAQDRLMDGVRTAFSLLSDDEINRPELVAEMDKQMRRIERLFGYEVGSHGRGV